jgi:hypothetical protein
MFGADRLDTNFNFYLDDLEVISVPQETAYGVGGRMLKGVLTLPSLKAWGFFVHRPNLLR